MIALALHDAPLCRHGAPTWAALSAYAWLMDDIRETAPSFKWCCGWLEDKPETIRAQGMRNRWSYQRMGGIPRILEAWQEAAAAFQAHHEKLSPAARYDLQRRTKVRDQFLQRKFYGGMWQREFRFADSEAEYISGGSSITRFPLFPQKLRKCSGGRCNSGSITGRETV